MCPKASSVLAESYAGFLHVLPPVANSVKVITYPAGYPPELGTLPYPDRSNTLRMSPAPDVQLSMLLSTTLTAGVPVEQLPAGERVS